MERYLTEIGIQKPVGLAMTDSVEIYADSIRNVNFNKLYEAEENLIDAGLLKGASPSENGVRTWYLDGIKIE